ncbi:acetyl-CoA carboxylase biotin carboxylase subunit [Yunchengibacter salinarum]|uniref:acetyl-CoA carboxylase biotin carboxylase subunit n=1 Tax=Yunchengibacter salinarum TaxID=3133399 RepID=UPI0035B67CF2
MFKKILIANRGEIACRIIRSARALGVKTVAVYSEADEDAIHKELADEAVLIGPPAASASYLKGDVIIQAAKDTGAEAIHPGYGFLSEKVDFVRAVEAAGLTFIGPNPRAIEDMGDKITSKRIAAEAGVNTVPGHMGIIEDVEEAVKIAGEIGFPVMLKASAGGGGKGMRIAWDEDECREGFSAARSEAMSSFADDRVFIEKFVEQPRHIEIQVLGDAHGTVVHLGERECSIQRRHQKVVEEAPSPFLDEETRAAMGAQAVALARAVDYNSAGTVEFIVDKDKNFYFLEMNTRLQVEHPVTEEVTGIDLVEAMLRVASGEKLGLTQDDIRLTGWSVETRVYAEDPFRGFLPSIGRLTHYSAPQASEHVRIDTGVEEGDEISMFYDPMIAKLVTRGQSRDEAIAAQLKALNSYYIRGIGHNVPFLAALMRHPRFQGGALTTNFIPEEYPDGFEGAPIDDGIKTAMIAGAIFAHAVACSRGSQISGRIETVAPPQERNWVALMDGERQNCSIVPLSDTVEICIGTARVSVSTDWAPGVPVMALSVNGADHVLAIEPTQTGYLMSGYGAEREVRVMTARAAGLDRLMPEKVAPDTSKMLLCPMPGLVVSLNVSEGDPVKAGQPLAVIEAMKMENILRAERDATVSAIHVEPGDSLSVDAVIMEFE